MLKIAKVVFWVTFYLAGAVALLWVTFLLLAPFLAMALYG